MQLQKKYFISPIIACGAFLSAPHAHAITVSLDYTYDTGNFFSNAEAKAALEAARDTYVNLIDNSFNAITPGTVYNAGTGSEFSDTWSATFTNPTTGAAESILDMSLAADTIVIYVGARNLTSLAEAGRGGYSSSGIASFNTSVNRGDSSDNFALWGGSATFDSVGTDWHFNHETAVESGKNDFYSTALHELGHIFGLGANSDAWNDHWVQGEFSGANALAAYNNDNGLSATSVATSSETGNRHFAMGVQSYIYGTTTLQEVSLDPDLTVGTRKLLTNVDVGALEDIGWQIIPEPSSTSLLSLAGLSLILRRKRQS